MAKAPVPLEDWLRRIETLSPHEIELGLDRVRDVLGRLSWRRPERVFIVGGTNGKGSSVEMLASLIGRSGASVGAYTSPHILKYNERIAVQRAPATDAEITAAFERVEAARRDVPLTYFEFGTLAALCVFESREVETAILEVGMGGRLDAVNAVEPDASLITNVALDHCDWLGPDIETIAVEKAGIMRSGRPAIYADRGIPAVIVEQARELGAGLVVAGEDYDWHEDGDTWSWQGLDLQLAGLAWPSLTGRVQLQNAAGVLALLEAAGMEALLEAEAVSAALRDLSLPGRMQRVQREHEWLFDVAHNPAAAAVLAATLQQQRASRTVGVIGMLDDKDVEGVVGPLGTVFDDWIAMTAESPRAIPAEELGRRIANASGKACLIAASAEHAVAEASRLAGSDGRIVVTGSFYVVGPLLRCLSVP